MIIWKKFSKYILSIISICLQALKFLLKCIAIDWAIVDTKTGRETMMKCAKFTRIMTIASSAACHIVSAFYVIVRLFFIKYDDNKLFVRAYYPYDTITSPNYELTMISQVIGGTYSVLIDPSVDTFIAMLVLHACGQITNLKNELKEIHPHEKTKLKKIVRKHNYIARFVLKAKLLISMGKVFLTKPENFCRRW